MSVSAPPAPFGGPCQTPDFERLAAGGLKYTRFHTTALCSPTRQALLTGRNHHSVGMGGITEIATSAPGNSSVRPNTKAPLAETLKLNGYRRRSSASAMRCRSGRRAPAGPFDAWPTGGGVSNTFTASSAARTTSGIRRCTKARRRRAAKTPEEGYHLTEDLADKAIAWTRQQKALMPDKPFFIYFAPGATHAPHHVPNEWIDKYKGKFATAGTSSGRLTFDRQKELGVIPPDSELTPRHEEIPAWDEMADELKPVLEREMEVYAAFMEHTDHHVGRLLDALKAIGALEDTLIYLIIGDNGASAEGTSRAPSTRWRTSTAWPRSRRLNSWSNWTSSAAKAYSHYAVGWAWAMNTPYQWTKQVASHWGGTRNGTIVHWPTASRKRAACAASSAM